MIAPLPPGPPPRHGETIAARDIGELRDRIDVRSPAEFAIDHIPGAVNLPVLDDDERAQVGTVYVKVSAFEARKIGAALASRNIARMLETFARDKPHEWRPLVYCWRGGQRSRAVTHVLAEIGWHPVQLAGGYRAYRGHVIEQLASLPQRLSYRVICGLTGSGKSRLLAAMGEIGEQTLDLEGFARHRGSLLGDLPNDPQPSQKWFESQLVDALSKLDPARPTYVESESKRIGTVQLPDALLDAMRMAPCVHVETPLPLRVALLKQEYAHFLADAPTLAARLAPLTPLHGRKTIERWEALASAGEHDALVTDLLALHYDPNYSRSLTRNFPRHEHALVAAVHGIEASGFVALAREVASRVAREAEAFTT